MKAPVNSRYAHCDGITDITVYQNSDQGKLLTCGSDGDVRLWVGPEDQDPVVFSATDTCLCLSSYKDTLYVGTENNSVETYALPSGKAKGVVAKFTAAVNHLDISTSGKILVACSGDMTFQILKLDDTESGPPIKVEGHSAPVLSVLIDPKEEFIVSTGCDGNVCIWTMNGKQVKTWDRVFPSSNDIMTSQTLCRPSWNSSGTMLAVPEKDQVVLYSRGTWTQSKVLKTSQSIKMLSVSRFSACGKFLAVGSTNGTVIVWNADTGKMIYENVDTKDHITGIVFSKCGKDIFAVDMKGRMIFIKQYNSSHETQDFDFDDEFAPENQGQIAVEKGVVDDDDPFEDDMDGMLVDDNDADGNEFSISKIKAMSGFIASEKEDVFVGIDKAKQIAGIKADQVPSKPVDDDDALSVSSFEFDNDKKAPSSNFPKIMPFTEPQKPFQPSSSPKHLDHRFMAWNSIGIIRNYSIEDDDTDAIDIEFHDVSFHNGIHLRNQYDYTVAALGNDAVVFASQVQKDTGSKLMCLHFASSDNNKEWAVDLPIDEEITGLAVGTGWLAAATDLNKLRIFSVGGFQKDIIEVGGQIIAISGHEDLLFIAFHNGIGLHGNQCVAYSVLKVRSRTGVFPLISNEVLPLTPKSQLTWLGFSDEGIPAYSDSREILRILNSRVWTTFLNMKENLNNENDHFWVTGISVCSQHVRAIKCKGARYPAALPRPTMILLDPKIPLCEPETEKSQLEELFLRSTMLNSITKKMDKKGFDVETYKEKAERDIKENLFKLFAISCKGDRDYRASEYVTVMPSTHSVQLAVKYANKLRKMALTDRLTAIGRKKMDEEEEGVEDDDDDFENMRAGNVIYSSVYTSIGNAGNNTTSFSHSGASEFFGNISGLNQSSSDLGIREENPLLRKQRAEINSMLTPHLSTNRFKKGTDGKSITDSKEDRKTDENGKGVGLIDAWKKPVEKQSMEFNPKHPKNKTSKKAADKEKAEKKTAPKSNPKQPTLFQMKGKAKKSNDAENPTSPIECSESLMDENSVDFHETITEDSTEDQVVAEPEKDITPKPPAKKIGFFLWFDINKSTLESENPDASLEELTKLGTKVFKALPSEEKQKYLNPTTSETTTTEKKRKRTTDEDVDLREDEAEKKSRISSKLAAFAKRD